MFCAAISVACSVIQYDIDMVWLSIKSHAFFDTLCCTAVRTCSWMRMHVPHLASSHFAMMKMEQALFSALLDRDEDYVRYGIRTVVLSIGISHFSSHCVDRILTARAP